MQDSAIVFQALADPTRRAILQRLAQGEAGVMELAAPFAISQPAVSRHLQLLEAAGLIERRVEGTRRPCRLAGPGLAAARAWLAALAPPDDPPAVPAAEDKPRKKSKKKRKKRAKP